MSSYRFNLHGGIERASYEIARRMADSGHDLTLAAYQMDPAPAAPLRWQPIRMPRHPGLLAPALYPRLATRQLDYTAFDVTHNQGGCALMRQDVVTAHSCHRAWVELKRTHGESLRALLNPHHHEVLQVERANYRPGAYRRVIAVSEGVGREVQRWYGVPAERITVVPNGVDLDRFRPPDRDATRARLRAQHGFREADVVLLWVGKEFRRKGLAPAIEALPLLPPQAKLLVVGGDDQAPYRARARALGVLDRIVFAGHSSAVQDYVQAADVFVFPTLYEAFALVTLEAAAAGLPLLTTRVNGTEELVVDGVNGFFIEREGASIAAAARPLVEDAALRARLGARALASVQDHTWDRVAQRTLDVYAEVRAEQAVSPR